MSNLDDDLPDVPLGLFHGELYIEGQNEPLSFSYLARDDDKGLLPMDDDKMTRLVVDGTMSTVDYLEKINSVVTNRMSVDDLEGLTSICNTEGYDPTVGKPLEQITGEQLFNAVGHHVDFYDLLFLPYPSDAEDIYKHLYRKKEDKRKIPYHEPDSFKVAVAIPKELHINMPYSEKELEDLSRFRHAVFKTNPGILGIYSSPALMKVRAPNPIQQAHLKRKEEDRIG